VTVLHGAVVARAEEGQNRPFSVQDHFPPRASPPKAGAASEVPMIGFHDLLRAHRPHVVLMDIEGAETQLFDRPWKCPLRFCVLELHPRHYPPRAIKRIVDAMSAMSMTYDPAVSRGKILGFRRVWKDDKQATAAGRSAKGKGPPRPSGRGPGCQDALRRGRAGSVLGAGVFAVCRAHPWLRCRSSPGRTAP
jgi:hypothetical protein